MYGLNEIEKKNLPNIHVKIICIISGHKKDFLSYDLLVFQFLQGSKYCVLKFNRVISATCQSGNLVIMWKTYLWP